MKKIISLSLSILLTICLVSNVYAASECKVSLQADRTQLAKNQEVSINVVLSDIQDEKGIFGLSAVLEYDQNSLEYVKIEEQEGWEKASYNKQNGIMSILREEEYATTNQTVLKITFKAKVENKENVEITLKDVTSSNGKKDIKIGDLKSTVTIKTNNGEDNENPGDNNGNNNNTGNNNGNNNNNNTGNNNSGNSNSNCNNNNNNSNNNANNNMNNNNKKPNDNIKNETLPKTGNKEVATTLVITGIALFAILAIVLYIRIRKINKM